jgi:uncharacterized membrane protein HdeD (DUF308 family)
MSEVQPIESDFVGAIKKNATLTVVTGVVLLICGLLAIGSPLAAGVSITIFVGAMLAVGGIAECFLAFKAGAFSKGLMIFIIGALTAIVGFYLMNQPLVGLAKITLFLAAYFIVTGIFDGIAAFQFRPAAGWGWMFLNAIVTLLLGIMIWRQFPLSGAWAIGVLFGIKLIFSGWSLIFIGRSVRAVASEAV